MGQLTNLYATTVVSEFDANKATTVNGGLQILDDAIAGILAISTTGGTTTLTGTPEAPQAQKMLLSVTGVLASNATIEIPVAVGTGRNRIYVVKNATSGAFTLTVKKVGGTGVTVGQGNTAFLLYNGTDIQYAAPQITSATGDIAETGTAFPSAPATNSRFFRTDRSVEYFWDGTRWLSTQVFNEPIPSIAGALPYAATTVNGETIAAPWATVYDLWLMDFSMSFYVNGGTALGASHKWVCKLNKTVANTVTDVATVNIDSGASSTWRNATTAINALLGSTHQTIGVGHTKTGTPGTLYPLPRLVYRLVG